MHGVCSGVGLIDKHSMAPWGSHVAGIFGGEGAVNCSSTDKCVDLGAQCACQERLHGVLVVYLHRVVRMCSELWWCWSGICFRQAGSGSGSL